MELAYVVQQILYPDLILAKIHEEAYAQALDDLTNAYAHRRALYLAAALAEPLKEAEEEAAGPVDRVAAAEQALLDVEREHAAKMVGFWKRFKPGDPKPAAEDPAVVTARANLDTARAEAKKPLATIQRTEAMIEALRGVPAPDLADLAAALKGA